jgi:hypothetical protein
MTIFVYSNAGPVPLTEHMIERIVERKMDRLDEQFLSGKLTQKEYDREMVALDKWASQQYKEIT